MRAGIVVSGTYAWKDKWQYMDSLIELAMKGKKKKALQVWKGRLMALKRPLLRKTSNGIKYLHLMGKDIQRLEEGIFRRRTEIIRGRCKGSYKV